jgi:hypothetical protein
MKTYILLFAFILAIGCKTNNKVQDTTETDTTETDTTKTNTTNKDMVVIMDDCPENAECTLALKNSASMTINEDSIGMLYPTIDNGDNMVVHYTYLKKGPEGTADGDYSETLHFEIPTNTSKLSLADGDLQNVGLLFGKHCFCRGEAGYYKVTKGSLILIKTEKELTFDISYTVDKTSQKMNHISKTIQLK